MKMSRANYKLSSDFEIEDLLKLEKFSVCVDFESFKLGDGNKIFFVIWKNLEILWNIF